MPRAFRIGPYHICFFACDQGEPRHVHVQRDGARAKFWLDPHVRLQRHRGFGRGEIGGVHRIVADHADELRRAWDEFFSR